KDEDELGLKLLEEIARYLMELSGSSALPRAVDLDRVTIPISSKGTTKRKAARQCSTIEVRKAREALGKVKKAPASEADRILRDALSRAKALADIDARTSKDTATFSGVPLASLHTFANALLRVPLARLHTSDE